MALLLSILLFVMVAGGTAWAGLSAGNWQSRGLRRLEKPEEKTPVRLPAPSTIWRDLVSRVGAALPASEKSLPLVKRRLIRAGIRHPHAERVLQGARLILTLVLAGAALFLAWRRGSPASNGLLGVGAAAAVGYIAPAQYLLLRIRRRQHAIARGLPNTLDLMVVCVESGLGIDQTTLQVAKELEDAHPEIASEFTLMNLEMRAGKRRAEALHNLAERTGVEEVRKLVAVLVQTDRFGTSIAQCLRGHAEYLRAMARQRAEERASKLAVKLVFPIFFCVLPSLFIVTVGPVITRLVRDLIPMIENM